MADKMFSKTRRFLITTGIVLSSGTGAAYFYFTRPDLTDLRPVQVPPSPTAFKALPSRREHIDALKSDIFDILIVGGGATGTGCALDAAARGLKVGLVEADDFASGTSSRSTKLVHGGVRYLEKAVKEFDKGQYDLVKEALAERATFLHIAPHLSYELPIMLPVYKWWQVPYFWVGCKLYDFLAGSQGLDPAHYVTKRKALDEFPMLKSDKLAGALVYAEAAHNDSRMNICLALTAVEKGAHMANHIKVVSLDKDATGQLCGALVEDDISKEKFHIKARCIINATGPFSDTIRQMDNPQAEKIVVPSSGVHLILPDYMSPRNMGLIDPATSDGRVLFLLPWEGGTLCGTTDAPCALEFNPQPLDKDIDWIINEVRRYLDPSISLTRSEIKSAWAGIRPLIKAPTSNGNTESLVRSHYIDVSESGLVTIAGGKWTTYRNMAEETIDTAVESCNLDQVSKAQTKHIRLVGADGYSSILNIQLIQHTGVDNDIARHLADSYGDRSWLVMNIADEVGSDRRGRERLHYAYPYIEAEVRYAARSELAQTALDVLARRTRLAFLDSRASRSTLDRVVDIMAQELGWSNSRKQQEHANALKYINATDFSKTDVDVAN